jgi:predicted RNA binding protein YcfA (HicA-like mRNA interferase family)
MADRAGAVASLRKLIERARNNIRSVRFAELARVLRAAGFEETGRRGSHVRFQTADRARLIIVVDPHGHGERYCDPGDVRKVLALLEE